MRHADISKSGPRCPNHGEPLEIPLKDKHLTKGRAPCPISGAMFEYEQETDTAKLKIDVFGNLTTEYIVKGND